MPGNWQLNYSPLSTIPRAAPRPRRHPVCALDGGFEEGHAGQAVGDAGVVEGLGRRLSPAAADGPFEGAMEVGQGLVKALRVAAGKPQVRADRAWQVTVIGPLAV